MQTLTVATAKITGNPKKNVEVLHQWCLAQPETVMEYPFGEGVRVYKVATKMFALVPEGEQPASISLKCDPLDAEVLRHKYKAVTGGYHLNKKHWNTISVDGEVPAAEIRAWIEDSFDLVVDSLPKAKRLLIQGQVRAVDD